VASPGRAGFGEALEAVVFAARVDATAAGAFEVGAGHPPIRWVEGATEYVVDPRRARESVVRPGQLGEARDARCCERRGRASRRRPSWRWLVRSACFRRTVRTSATSQERRIPWQMRSRTAAL